MPQEIIDVQPIVLTCEINHTNHDLAVAYCRPTILSKEEQNPKCACAFLFLRVCISSETECVLQTHKVCGESQQSPHMSSSRHQR